MKQRLVLFLILYSSNLILFQSCTGKFDSASNQSSLKNSSTIDNSDSQEELVASITDQVIIHPLSSVSPMIPQTTPIIIPVVAPLNTIESLKQELTSIGVTPNITKILNQYDFESKTTLNCILISNGDLYCKGLAVDLKNLDTSQLSGLLKYPIETLGFSKLTKINQDGKIVQDFDIHNSFGIVFLTKNNEVFVRAVNETFYFLYDNSLVRTISFKKYSTSNVQIHIGIPITKIKGYDGLSTNGLFYSYEWFYAHSTTYNCFKPADPIAADYDPSCIKNIQPFSLLNGIKDWHGARKITNHICAIDLNDDLYCMGGNVAGQLGIGKSSEYENYSKKVNSTEKFKFVMNLGYTTCAMTYKNTTLCWGEYYKILDGKPYDYVFTDSTNSTKGFYYSPVQNRIFDNIIIDKVEQNCALSRTPTNRLFCKLGPDFEEFSISPDTIDIFVSRSGIYVNDQICFLKTNGNINCSTFQSIKMN